MTGANLLVNADALTPADVGNKFFITLNDGTDAITGHFAQGTTVTADNGDIFTINYADNGDAGTASNDLSLTFTAVPEPGTWAAATLATALIGYRVTRRRRRGVVVT